MAWTVPRDWSAGEIVTESHMDVHVKDNLTYLKDIQDGVQGQAMTWAVASTDNLARVLTVRKARGTIGAPSGIAALDAVFDITTEAYNAGGYRSVGRIRSQVAALGATFVDGFMDFNVARSSDGTLVNIMRLQNGVAYFPDGAAAGPGVSFVNDPDTGMWRSSADTLQFSAGGGSKFTITPTAMTSTVQTTIVTSAAATLQVNQFSVDGVMVNLMRDSASIGSISVAAGVVAYNPFTGAHYTQLAAGQEAPPAGAVVVATGELLDGQRDTFSRIDGTETPADPRVYGVWIGEIMAGGGGHAVGDPDLPISNVAALGLHWCWVTDSGGDLAPGDLLETSARRWHAQRQVDGVIRNSTLGKYVGPPIIWAQVYGAEPKSARAPCVLYCG